MHFIVLSSSRGTVFGATLQAMKDGALHAQCLGLITDRGDRGCIEKAKEFGIPYRIVERNKSDKREDYDRRLDAAIKSLIDTSKNADKPDMRSVFIAAMGWLFILSPWFIRMHPGHILNVHPSLLPKFGGPGMYGHHVHKAVIDAKEPTSGMTIHLMDEGVDTGKILLQKECPVLPDDTEVTLAKRVGGLEKEWYPRVLEMIEVGELKV